MKRNRRNNRHRSVIVIEIHSLKISPNLLPLSSALDVEFCGFPHMVFSPDSFFFDFGVSSLSTAVASTSSLAAGPLVVLVFFFFFLSFFFRRGEEESDFSLVAAAEGAALRDEVGAPPPPPPPPPPLSPLGLPDVSEAAASAATRRGRALAPKGHATET